MKSSGWEIGLPSCKTYRKMELVLTGNSFSGSLPGQPLRDGVSSHRPRKHITSSSKGGPSDPWSVFVFPPSEEHVTLKEHLDFISQGLSCRENEGAQGTGSFLLRPVKSHLCGVGHGYRTAVRSRPVFSPLPGAEAGLWQNGAVPPERWIRKFAAFSGAGDAVASLPAEPRHS